MPEVSSPKSLRDLFTTGTAAGLADADLLARFRSGSDETAFETLVARHGPMVWRVCRDLLADEHAAEDAFQATFLVLVRKAGSVRVDDSLGRWLYGVAWRVAQHARADLHRRRQREGESPPEPAGADGEADRRELRAIVQAELAQLPERFRAPIVLCHLEGLSHEEAARQLRCPVGTVRSRLARGRDRLRDRLSRLGAPAVSIPLLEPAGGAVPARLMTATVQAAVAWGKGAGLISASVLSLAKGAMLAMMFAPMKLIATGLVAAGLVGIAGTALVARPERDPAVGALAGPAAPFVQIPTRSPPAGPLAAATMVDQATAGELDVRLQFAEQRMRLMEAMQMNGQAPVIEVVKLKEEVAVLRSLVDAQAERLRDEVQLLQVEKEVRKAELMQAQAHMSGAEVQKKATDRQRESNVVSAGEVALAAAKLDDAQGEVMVKQARLHEAEIRIQQATRRLEKVEGVRARKPAEPPKAEAQPAVPPPAPPPPPGAAAGR